MAGANNPDREFRAFLAGIGAPEAFEEAPHVAERHDDGGTPADEGESYGSYLHGAAEEDGPDPDETGRSSDEAISAMSDEPAPVCKRGPGAGRHEMAWPALLVLFLALAWLPQGPDLAGSAMAGEKAGAKTSAAAKASAKAGEQPAVAAETVASPPAEPAGTAVAPDAVPAGEGEAAVPAGEGEPPAEGEEVPPPPGNPEEIEQQAEGLLSGKKFDAAADLVRENEGLLASSPRLLEILLEAGIQTSSPNWLDLGNKAQELVDQNPDSPVGNLALGMSWANRKKADLAKALEYLAKAKSSKKALAMAGSTYWTVWAKKNWPMMAGVLALLMVGGFKIVQKRKQSRQAAAELEKALAEAQPVASGDGAAVVVQSETAEKPGQDAAKPAVPEKPAVPAKPAQPEGEKAPEPAAAKPAAKTVAKPGIRPGTKLPPKPGMKPGVPAHKPVQKSAVPAPNPVPAASEPEEPAQQDRAPLAPKPPARPAVAALEETPDLSGIDLVTAHLQTAGMPAQRPPHLPGREVETVWQNLVRQASARPLPLDVREPAPPPPPPPVIDPATAGEVTLDLSEKAAASELVTKLRMLAISDGELRTLLQLRNPEHLPALVEYITMKPDPVRLAFLAREMGNFHDPAVSDILSTLLYHPDHRVGLSAIQGLQINGGVESVLAICPFLESDVPVLVDAARTALMDYGPQRVLEGLARLPSHPDERARSAGVFVLSRMRGPAIARLLVAMLGDRSAEVRQKAILAMANQKDIAYLATLREYVRHAPEEDRKITRKAIVFLQTLEKTAG